MTAQLPMVHPMHMPADCRIGQLATHRFQGRFWHSDCPRTQATGRHSEVWPFPCGCWYCVSCHTLSLGPDCGPDDGEDA